MFIHMCSVWCLKFFRTLEIASLDFSYKPLIRWLSYSVHIFQVLHLHETKEMKYCIEILVSFPFN